MALTWKTLALGIATLVLGTAPAMVAHSDDPAYDQAHDYHRLGDSGDGTSMIYMQDGSLDGISLPGAIFVITQAGPVAASDGYAAHWVWYHASCNSNETTYYGFVRFYADGRHDDAFIRDADDVTYEPVQPGTHTSIVFDALCGKRDPATTVAVAHVTVTQLIKLQNDAYAQRAKAPPAQP